MTQKQIDDLLFRLKISSYPEAQEAARVIESFWQKLGDFQKVCQMLAAARNAERDRADAAEAELAGRKQ